MAAQRLPNFLGASFLSDGRKDDTVSWHTPEKGPSQHEADRDAKPTIGSSEQLRQIASISCPYWIVWVASVIMPPQGFRHVVDGPEGSICIVIVHAELGHAEMSRLLPPKTVPDNHGTRFPLPLPESEHVMVTRRMLFALAS